MEASFFGLVFSFFRAFKILSDQIIALISFHLDEHLDLVNYLITAECALVV